MIIIERKPAPLYESVCSECGSRFRYQRSEVSTGFIRCPVCGMSVWASAEPVDEEEW